MANNISCRTKKAVNRRSKALNATKDFQKINLQTVTVDGVKVKLSTREARTLKKSEKSI
ncbi:MAG: hypothetical protein WCR93_04305 [Bacilli bacterium]